VRCIHPLSAERTADGTIHLKPHNGKPGEWLDLPCGQCIECRLERTRQWAVRITHEATFYQDNWFLTLTYNQDKLPRSLEHEHFQAFWKRLRQHQARLELESPRYYMCGEYGDKTKRPHYHAIAFGLKINDLKLYSKSKDKTLYTSETINNLWRMGEVKIGAVTFESASYVASYCTKKVTGKNAAEHYTRTDENTNEIYEIEPEYSRMSLKPGIGQKWIEKYTDDVYNHDHVIINGRPQKAPRYYDKYLEKTEPTRLEKHKANRKEKAKNTETENTRQRLNSREMYTTAKYKQKQRTI